MIIAAILSIIFGVVLIGSVLVVPKVAVVIAIVIYAFASEVSRRKSIRLGDSSLELPID